MAETNRLRNEAYNKLMRMMNYPGRFPILVIGETGTGKMHSIKEICSNVFKTTDQLLILNAGLSEESSEYWEGVLKESDNKHLAIKDVEKLSNINQELLFEAMSTTNGQYGFKEKKYKVRILFTTTFSIKKIRDDRRYLNARFFDRISQFVVEFPNFNKTKKSISEDFKLTWEKLFFIEGEFIANCPKLEEFHKWLNTQAYRMHGNFRDLDKIAINWNFYQINLPNEKDPYSNESEEYIFKCIKDEFDIYLHNPSQSIAEDNIFMFDEDSNYEMIINDFRAKLKKWAMALNNNDPHVTAHMLGVSHRTLERWK